MKKQDPISFLENSFLSIKEYLKSAETSSDKMIITAEFIQILEQETKKVLALCAILNQDDDFVSSINAEVNRSNNLLLKAEHFFISDLITAYQQNEAKESPTSRFVLAYYYDALRNNHFADVAGISALNKLVTSEEFKVHLLKIKKDNTLSTTKNHYYILSTLAEKKDKRLDIAANQIQVFLKYAYNLDFSNTKELNGFLGFEPSKVKSKYEAAAIADDSLEKVMKELNELVGLENVKKDIEELINLLEIQKKRSQKGLKNIEISLHTVFLGPPGTGKTTVARLLGRIFKHLGFLSKGQLYETDREGMIAGYVGQTATKVDKIVEESIGGVLFIDEAYALTQNTFGNDYGAEAISILLKRMEDKRDDLVVVAAGYTEPMKLFIESNPGLNSRFNRYFTFKHFTPAELFQIFENFCKKSDFIVSKGAEDKLKDTFDLLYAKKDEGFGNARVVRNLFEKCVQNQANRIIKLKKISPGVLKAITEEDIPEPKETEKKVYFSNEEEN
ncbi:AAA family ATPase [Pedobacter frigiditerrae]|uniref:AAA family ATPase n=1 Tax=Pedobacter frigiditerrae TaxID=2530452 RepID=UPI00292F5967|nr:AAA family ATPase [Pedobacter frigiditerrae]